VDSKVLLLDWQVPSLSVSEMNEKSDDHTLQKPIEQQGKQN